MRGSINSTTASAPGKLMLFGEHSVVYGHPCIVTAVDYRVCAEVSVSRKDSFEFPEGNGANFVSTALDLFRKKYDKKKPVRVKTWAGYKNSHGLGSSSAVTVALTKALSALFSVDMPPADLFSPCYDVVLRVQGVGSGFDIAAAVYGGSVYFVTGGEKIEPLNIEKLPLVVGYSGVKADTAVIVKDLKKRYEGRERERDAIFDEISTIVESARRVLEKSDWKEAGALMTKNHALLSRLGVNTKRLDDLCAAALSAGAYGAKLSGAGGGDCMIALVDEKRRSDVENAIKKAGATILDVKANEEGALVVE